MLKKVWPLLLLALACLPIIWALFPAGFFITHDGEYNLIRLMQFDRELWSGQFPVRWAFAMNYDFGSPIFSFFYPLIYYLSSLIHLAGLDYSSSLKAVIALATIGSSWVVFTWLKRYFPPLAAFFGSLVYLYVPYRMVVMYVTGSYGVLLSFLFLPLGFLATDKISSGQRHSLGLLSVSILGLLTAHNVTALIFLPVLLGYITIKGWNRVIATGFILGLGLAASFVLPAIFETSYVHLSQGVAVNFRDHFPNLFQLIYSPWGYGFSERGNTDGMSFQIGLAGLTIISLSVLTLMFKKGEKPDQQARLGGFFVVMLLVGIFFMLPISLPLWETIPILPQIQFPWRLLALVVVGTPYLGAYLVQQRFGKIILLFLLLLLFWNNRNYLRTWEATRYTDERYQSRQAFYFGSTDIAGETLPIWAKNRPTWFNKLLVKPNEVVKIIKNEQNRREIKITALSAEPTVLTINRLYYPIFTAWRDTTSTQLKPTERDGLMGVDLPVGIHHITISQSKTRLQKLADWITFFSAAVILGLMAEFTLTTWKWHKVRKLFSSGYAWVSRRMKHKK